MENITESIVGSNNSISIVDNITTTAVLDNITAIITSTIISIITNGELNVSSTTENPLEVLTTSLPTYVTSTTTATEATTTSMMATTSPSLIETLFPTTVWSTATPRTTTVASITPEDLFHHGRKHGKFHRQGYEPSFGKTEATVIICFVALVLFAAAKYIGCKPSYFCISWDSLKLSRPRADGHHNHHNPFHRHHENVLARPEYARNLQYAVYSRPSTAHVNNLERTDARGYGYSDFGAQDDRDQVKVYTRGFDDPILDPPPEYDSLVPPAYNPNSKGGSFPNANYYSFESSNRMGDIRL